MNQGDFDPQAFPDSVATLLRGTGLIWAQSESGVIGAKGVMPWHLSEDLKHFSALTRGHAVVMGRRTWESFPEKYRPLPGRRNLVITRNAQWAGSPEAKGATVFSSLESALQAARGPEAGPKPETGLNEVVPNEVVPNEATQSPAASAPATLSWVIGGGEIYRQALTHADFAVITVIDTAVEGDTFAPELPSDWVEAAHWPETGWHTSTNGTRFRFVLSHRPELSTGSTS